MRKRCERIIVRTHAEQENLVRTYELVYLDERVAQGELLEPILPRNGVSLLSQVRVVGHDETQPEVEGLTQALPPLEFAYTTFEPSEQRYQPFSAVSNSMPERSLAHGEYEMVDLFGHGLPDIVQMNGVIRYWRNLGGGVLDLPRTMEEAPAGVRLEDNGVQMADLNGDGRTDLLVTDAIRGGYYSLTFGEGWDRRGFVRYEQLPSVDLEAPDVRLVDIDGDGVVDAVRTGPRFELYYNDPQRGWIDIELRERGSPDAFPDVDFSDPRVRLGDMTGDGLQDIIFIHNGRMDYWPYLGYGKWGRRVTMRNSPHFEDAAFFPGIGFDPNRVLLGDIDGDGLDDIVYVGSGHITVWINQSGNGWSDPIAIGGTPFFTDVDAVRTADMLGLGTAGILWTYDHHQHGDSTYKFLDLTGSVKPYVLHEMNNHMGATTRVEYAPSTRFYLEDEKRPETRWQTPLPFPVQVVARVEVIDHLSGGKLTTEYSYHHGYWDGEEREFRGFGRVDQRDTEVFDRYHTPGLHLDRSFEAVEQTMFSPPLETRTWFHQGAIEDEYGDWTGPDLGHEFFSGDPNVLPRLDGTEALLKDLPRQARRDALRALRGSVLRTELYALDGSDREGRPFTVAEHLHSVREEAPPGPGEDDRRRIFFAHTLAQRTTQWERGDDPMTQFSFTDDYDVFGQPRRQTQIACPRGWRDLQDTPNQPFLATRSRTIYAEPVDFDVYIVDRVAKITTHEIKNDGSRTVLALSTLPDDSPDLQLIGQTLNFYDGEAFVGRPFGEAGERGALVRSESLVLTEDLLHQAYKSGDTISDPPEVPPYLVPDSTPSATDEYPEEFLDLLPPLAGYTFHPGGAEHARGYYVTTARHRYDFHDPGGKARGLLKVTKDPLGRDTTIDYDNFELLPKKVTDPVGLITGASYDLRVLQPREVTDPNGNRTEYTFTPLGLLKEIFIRGKAATEGDDSRPSTRFEYGFLTFANSRSDQRQPTFVHTIQHEHHDTETDVPLPGRNASMEIDALGRTIKSVERNGPDPATDWFTTRSIYDIRGNLLTVADALSREASWYTYDLADNPLRIESIDAGLRRTVLDAGGSETERRDSKGALILQAHDFLRRPTRMWARDDAGSPVTLRERLVYGDGGDPAQDPTVRAANRAENRLGALHEHYDEAGRLTLERYDFKSNVLEKARQVIGDDAILKAPGSAFRVDWQPPEDTMLEARADTLLDQFGYRISATYDALDRVKTLLYPEDVKGERKALRPRYNRAGALEQVVLHGEVFVEHVAYDAKGQRTFIALGNGVMTRYAYDPQTFRLARLRTERFRKPDPDAPVYERAGTPLQDFAHDYDLAGNISAIHDRTPASGVPNTLLGTDALDRVFSYDPLYRLLSATGRECDRPPNRPPWDDRPRCVDINRVRAYTEQYQYDRVGNLRQMQHTAGAGSFTRTLAPVPDSNRLATLTVGNGFNRRSAYAYDASGNLIRENTGRHFEWDHST